MTAWLHRSGMGDTVAVDEPVLAALNLAIQLRRLVPRLRRPVAVLELTIPAAGTANLLRSPSTVRLSGAGSSRAGIVSLGRLPEPS